MALTISERIISYLIDHGELIEEIGINPALFEGKHEKKTINAIVYHRKKYKQNPGIAGLHEVGIDGDFIARITVVADQYINLKGFMIGLKKFAERTKDKAIIHAVETQKDIWIKDGSAVLDKTNIFKAVDEIRDLDATLTGSQASELLCFEGITEREVEWHLPSIYARGMIHSLGGVQGHGKSLHLIDLAARTSTGAEWPITGESIPKGDVLYITDEDSRDKIIKPRLRLAGADMSRVFIPDFNIENLTLPDDAPKIEAWLGKMTNPRLVMLDPLVDYSTKGLNASESATGIIKPLKSLADKMGVCIIYTVHFNKNVDLDSIQRVAHSYVLTSKPRLAWLIIKEDPSDDLNCNRFLCCGKSAFKPIPNMAFTIKGDKSDTPYIDEWRTVKMSTAAALATGERRRDLKVEEAEAFLIETLGEQGQMFSSDLKELAEKKGIDRGSFYRARAKLGTDIEDDFQDRKKLWKLKI